jgi:hypothetical protein
MLKKVTIGLVALTLAGGLGATGYGLYQSGVDSGARDGTGAGRGSGWADAEGTARRAEGERYGSGGGGHMGQGALETGEHGPRGGTGGQGQQGQRGGWRDSCDGEGCVEDERGGPGWSSGEGRAEEPDWITLEGTVTEVSTGQLTLETPDGEEVLALGPEYYWSAQGIAIEVGDEVEARAYEEDGELKVGQITLTATGETLTLRDEMGRPLWSGGAGQGQGGAGQGQGGAGQGKGGTGRDGAGQGRGGRG